jgi:hypothetical protein
MIRRVSVVLSIAVLMCLCTPCPAGEHNTLTKEEISDGWILLFDGDTLFGWETHGECTWKVADGILMCDTGKDGWLGTTSEFTDFVLKLQYRISANGNSGVFFRADKGPQPWVTGYEMQIWDKDENNPTGSIYNVKKAEYPGGELVTDVEKWQDGEIAANGERVTVTLNGQKVVDGQDGKYRRGSPTASSSTAACSSGAIREASGQATSRRFAISGRETTGRSPLTSAQAASISMSRRGGLFRATTSGSPRPSSLTETTWRFGSTATWSVSTRTRAPSARMPVRIAASKPER